MTVEYYVKRKVDSSIVHTCSTVEAAQAAIHRLPAEAQGNYAVFYSKDAIRQHVKRNHPQHIGQYERNRS